jgi:hypothetical protein
MGWDGVVGAKEMGPAWRRHHRRSITIYETDNPAPNTTQAMEGNEEQQQQQQSGSSSGGGGHAGMGEDGSSSSAEYRLLSGDGPGAGTGAAAAEEEGGGNWGNWDPIPRIRVVERSRFVWVLDSTVLLL